MEPNYPRYTKCWPALAHVLVPALQNVYKVTFTLCSLGFDGALQEAENSFALVATEETASAHAQTVQLRSGSAVHIVIVGEAQVVVARRTRHRTFTVLPALQVRALNIIIQCLRYNCVYW